MSIRAATSRSTARASQPSARRRRRPSPDGFDTVIDAAGAIVVPGLINMHQHHWYTLFKGVADGYLLEDWVTDILLPLSLKLDDEAMRVSSTVAGHGDAVDRHHLLVQPFGDDHDADAGRSLDRAAGRARHPSGLRQGAALPHARQPAPSARASTRRWRRSRRKSARWNGAHGGLVRFGMAIESNAHWVAAGMSTEELIVRGYELAGRLGLKHHHAHVRRHVLAGKGLPEVPARDRSHRRALPDAARHPRSAMDADPRHPLHRARHRADGAGRLQLRLHADAASRCAAAASRRSPTRSAPASTSRSAPTDRWSTIRSTWSSR